MALIDRWTRSVGLAEDLEAYEFLIYKDSKISISQQSASATMVYLVAWSLTGDSSNMKNFLSDVLGYSYIQASTTIKRVLPSPHPDFAYFYAQDCEVEGVGYPTGNDLDVEYPIARITVTYRPVDYAVLADGSLINGEPITEIDRYLTRKFSMNGQYLSIGAATMKFVTPPNILTGVVPGRIVGMMDLEYTWHQVPSAFLTPFVPPNIHKVNTCQGKVNSVAFDPNGINAPAGTILCEAVDPKMMLPTLGGSEAEGLVIDGGIYAWEINYKFKSMDNGTYVGGVPALAGESCGHNYVYRIFPGGATPPFWDLQTPDGTSTGGRIYQATDLNALFSLA